MVNYAALYLVFGAALLVALIALAIALTPGHKKGKVVH
jgi:hypothetical protein